MIFMRVIARLQYLREFKSQKIDWNLSEVFRKCDAKYRITPDLKVRRLGQSQEKICERTVLQKAEREKSQASGILPSRGPGGGSPPPAAAGGPHQTWDGPFSAVSKPMFAIKYSLEWRILRHWKWKGKRGSPWRDLRVLYSSRDLRSRNLAVFRQKILSKT